MSNEEYKYFKDILLHNNGEFRMSTFRLMMYFQFNRLPSELEMSEALNKFDNTLMKMLKFILED